MGSAGHPQFAGIFEGCPGRLWSLWEMQHFYADRFVTCLNMLHGVQFALVNKGSSVALDSPSHLHTLKLQLSELAKHLEALRLPMTRRSVLELFHALENPLPDR